MFTKIRVAVTRQCEMSCIYCPHGPVINMENFDGEETYCMTDDELMGVLSVMIGRGLKEVHFTGGEPLRRKGLSELIRRTAALGAHPELNTNGLGLTSRKARDLKVAGLDFIKISLDVPNRGDFLSFTGLDAFEKVVNGINATVQVLPVRLNCVVMRLNLDSLVPLIRMADELGVQKIHLLDLTFYPCVGGASFWEKQFVYLTKEVMGPLEAEFGGKFHLLPIYGCRFYEMETRPGGVKVILKEAQPTMRSPECANCPGYCHEGVFTLRLSAGGYLNFCPCMNETGINALKLWREGQFAEALDSFQRTFEQARPVDSFPIFLERNRLRYPREG
jgi:molybdenum cofactor biosynthesis enzyme MoaA